MDLDAERAATILGEKIAGALRHLWSEVRRRGRGHVKGMAISESDHRLAS